MKNQKNPFADHAKGFFLHEIPLYKKRTVKLNGLFTSWWEKLCRIRINIEIGLNEGDSKGEFLDDLFFEINLSVKEVAEEK